MSRSEIARKKAKADALLSVTVRDILEAINTPKSLAAWMLYHHDEHVQLLDLKIDPKDYTSANSFADDYQAVKLLSKYPFLNTGIDTKAEGLTAFVNAEEQCRYTNLRLRSGNPQGACYSVLRLARKIIAETLDGCSESTGFSPGSIQSVLNGIGWGPGVTSSTRGTNLSSYHKLQSDLELTTELLRLPIQLFADGVSVWNAPKTEFVENGIGVWRHSQPAQSVRKLKAVHGNKVTFVPKNAKTDRPIAIEPHLNALFQRGVGKFIAKRLLQCLGVNLRDQSRNQHLAKIGSLEGNLCTLDLKSASDTVAQACVELLLPRHWVVLFDCVRSQNYTLDGEVFTRYRKHSSMGNGYTFELESLIFSALTKAVIQYLRLANTTWSVYGDDIIAPIEAAPLLIEVLEYVGFTLNEEKSFTTGPFRESCGKDYFNGINVRPFFIRERLITKNSIFKLVNSVRRYSHMRVNSMGCDARFFVAWRNLFKSLPKRNRRYRGPDGHGDNWIIGNFDECAQHVSTKRNRHLQRVEYRVSSWKFRALVLAKGNDDYAVASALFLPNSLDPHEPEDAKLSASSSYMLGKKLKLREVSDLDLTVFSPKDKGRWTDFRATVLQWPDLGPWL